jgi:metal-responsive CopG/Arc/MetJ family transcriptional regulator
MPKAPMELLGVKLPPELLARLNAYAKKAKNEDRSDLVRRFVREGLDREAPR